MADYERYVLACIAFGKRPDDPGAAWWAAVEALAGSGYIKRGALTAKGRAALTPTN